MNWLLTSRRHARSLALAACTLIGLIGCGGGGGGGDPAPPPTAQAPIITAGPQDVAVQEGAPARFSVTATGTGLGYQWQVAGRPVADATGPTLTLPAVTRADDGATVAVTVSNTAGSVQASARLAVAPLPVAPVITTQPQSLSVVAGAAASFTVAATGSEPMSFQWFRNGTAIAGATMATHALPAAALADAGQFRVQVQNAAGQTTSEEATLTVQPAVSAPAITQQPQGAAVTTGGRLSLSVVAQGTDPLAYAWQKDGVLIAGATAATFAKEPVDPADAGTYRVTVSNAAGSVTSAAAVVTVAAAPQAPSIRTQPRNAQVNVGASVVFRVTADGTPPLTYQWRRNGVPVAGATGESFMLAPATLGDDAARFSVVVSGAAGQVTSADALLTVGHLGQVALGSTHSLALKLDGSVFSWGENANGQLGDGSTSDRNQPVTVQADPATPLAGIAAIAAGPGRSLALRRDGSVLAWGLNRGGLLADGTTDDQPLPVPVLAEAGGAPLSGVNAIAAGEVHSLALRQDGTLLAWGRNSLGQLGNPTTVERFPVPVLDDAARPVTGIVAISAGSNHSLALRADGTVLSWGLNLDGQLGDGTDLSSRGFAAPVTDASGRALTGIRAIAAGGDSSYALRADGTVLAWGANSLGQLGDGTFAFRKSPVTVVDAQGAPLAGIQSLSAGQSHVLALDADACVHSWGDNVGSQLGTSELIGGRNHSGAVEIATGARLCAVRSLGSARVHNIVISQSGGLLGWGTNSGRLGDGTNSRRQFPTAVLLPGTMF